MAKTISKFNKETNPFDSMQYTSKPLTSEVLGTLDNIKDIADELGGKFVVGGGVACSYLNVDAELASQKDERGGEISFEQKKSVIDTINRKSRISDIDGFSTIPVYELLANIHKHTGRGFREFKNARDYVELVYNDLKFQITETDPDDFTIKSSRIVKIPKNRYSYYEIPVVHPGYIAVFKLQRCEMVDPGDVMGMVLVGSLKREDIEYALHEMSLKKNQENLIFGRYDSIVKRSEQ